MISSVNFDSFPAVPVVSPRITVIIIGQPYNLLVSVIDKKRSSANVERSHI